MTPEQKQERKVWKLLGDLTVVGYIDKEMQARLYYVKTGKSIRVEDFDNIMCYKIIRDADLACIGMTVKSLEEFLIAHGVKKYKEPRRQRSFSLYD